MNGSTSCADPANGARTTSPALSIGVLICSYRRTKDLLRCLASLEKQERLPEDIIIVARTDDTCTIAALSIPEKGMLRFRILITETPGLVNARNVGLDACRTDILAMIDDDTVPHTSWLARIVVHFERDAGVGAVGGRDWCHNGNHFDDRNAALVGQLQWYGRAIGNHHLGVGAPRPTDFLKGANMSYRFAAVGQARFDTRLRGHGAQPHEDLQFSLSIRRRNWVLLYDPGVAVDHYVAGSLAPRPWAGIDNSENGLTDLFDLAFNEVLALWPSLTLVGRLAYPLWSIFIGTGLAPGLVQAIRFTRPLGWVAWRRFWVTQKAKAAAYLEIGGARRSRHQERATGAAATRR